MKHETRRDRSERHNQIDEPIKSIEHIQWKSSHIITVHPKNTPSSRRRRRSSITIPASLLPLTSGHPKDDIVINGINNVVIAT